MNKEKIIMIGIITIIIGILGIFYYQKYKMEKDYKFQIYFFNAGKADAILLSKNNKYIMIDTGEENLSKEILNYFRQKNITKLEYLIITHFDKDHVGSAAAIIRNIKIGKVLQSNVPKESEFYNAYITALEEKKITPKTISGDNNIKVEDLEIIINGPTTIYPKKESNNSSLIVSIKDNKNKFLFTGDIQNARLKDFVASNPTDYNFLKVPYHGNYLKRLEELLKINRIQYAVITSSEEEKEDPKTLELLSKYQIKTYLTRNGSIKILSNGSDIKIRQN